MIRKIGLISLLIVLFMAFSFFKKSDKGAKKEETHGPKYYELTVKEIIQETKDAISIVFNQPAENKIHYKAGQFLTIITPVQGKEVRRAYSLCSSPFVDPAPGLIGVCVVIAWWSVTG